MKTLIIYKSSTGFTKKYAEMTAEETGCDILEFKKASAAILSGYDRIVYGSRVHAGLIDGLKKARQMFDTCSAKELVIFATGGTPNSAEKVIAEIWNNNLSEEERNSIPHFYMQAGMNYEKMGFADKTIMKMVSKMMEKKDNKDSVELGFEQAITESYDITSREYILPLVKYLNGDTVK